MGVNGVHICKDWEQYWNWELPRCAVAITVIITVAHSHLYSHPPRSSCCALHPHSSLSAHFSAPCPLSPPFWAWQCLWWLKRITDSLWPRLLVVTRVTFGERHYQPLPAWCLPRQLSALSRPVAPRLPPSLPATSTLAVPLFSPLRAPSPPTQQDLFTPYLPSSSC